MTVETHLPGGLPGFTLVGLPETAVREARDRVKSALQNCGFSFPAGRVVVNLAPADLVKTGARYDLAIAVSILCATEQISHALACRFEYLGELSLYGDVRPVRGVLSALHSIAQLPSKRALVAPTDNANEARGYNEGLMSADGGAPPTSIPPLLTINHLSRLPDLLKQPADFTAASEIVGGSNQNSDSTPDLAHNHTLDNVLGQQAAKRALVVAAAGGHHLLMVGPPGSGKTLLARCLPDLLPALNDDRAMQVGAIHSAAGLPAPPAQPPFREPHHSASSAAIAGGGTSGHVQPGEISLAHNGVLFLDELPHFKPSVLDLLREPMSNGYISIARAQGQTRFPAGFQLLAAMNPCPAGLACVAQRCRCTLTKVRNYQSRVSGPLLDRIDIQISVPALATSELLQINHATARVSTETDQARQQVAAAQARQMTRQGHLNSATANINVNKHQLSLSAAAQDLLRDAVERLDLSARGYHRSLRVAQTIADLADSNLIEADHLGEALAYRSLDWANFLGLQAL